MTEAKKTSAKKQNVFQKMGKFFRACLGEIKKISWTPPLTVTKNWAIVLVVIVISGLFIFGLDYGLNALLNLVMKTAA